MKPGLRALRHLQRLRPLPFHWRPWPQARVAGVRHFGHLLALALSAITLLYAQHGQAKPGISWHWIDLLSEGLAVAMLALWLGQVRASRPEGHVTTWLSLGLSGLLMGAWADLMDEFWKVPHPLVWLWGLESSLNLLGMGALTWGLQQWRGEQLTLNAQQQRRERLFREHRSIDTLTQLGDASYMAAQLQRERAAGRHGQLLMLGWPGLETVCRQQGLAAAEQLLKDAAQLLLLHLQPDELLCRYAQHQLLVLLPAPPASAGHTWASANHMGASSAPRMATGAARAAALQQALACLAQLRAPDAGTPAMALCHWQADTRAPEALMLALLQQLGTQAAETADSVLSIQNADSADRTGSERSVHSGRSPHNATSEPTR